MADMETKDSGSVAPTEENLLDRLIRMVQQDTPPDVPVANPMPVAPPSQGGLLGGLMSNPAILQMLPQLLGGLSGNGTKNNSSNTDSRLPSTTPPKASHTIDRHTALLCAIKPYLGQERQRAAEDMIRICRMLSTLEGMGISLSSVLSGLTGVSQPSATVQEEVSDV